MPPRYTPETLTYHQLVMDCVDLKDRLDILYAMQSDTFRAWGDSIQRNDTQDMIDAYEKVYKTIRRRTTWIFNKLWKAREERNRRDINQQKLLEQDAQKLRTTQGENAAGP